MDEPDAMRRAIRLAARGLGRTSPNPVVGCVLLSPSGEVVGEGWHHAAGQPHAEVLALRVAGAAARGTTAVVTLEPCTHQGRTPPCADALLAAGVRRVVYAVDDPVVGHGGADALRSGGIEVASGLMAAAAQRVNEAWLTSVRLGRPHVHWKAAATLDGRPCAPDGSSRWITGPVARAEVHRLRGQVDAIITGIGTVLADDPALTARDRAGQPYERQPLRVIVDSSGRTPAASAVRRSPGACWIATAAEVGEDSNGRVDLHRLLLRLRERGLVSVLLECGPILTGAFVAAGLVDRVTVFLAPTLLGAGPGFLDRPEVLTLNQRVQLAIDEVRLVGDDLLVSGVVGSHP